MAERLDSRYRPQAGIALLEVLVAFSILALLLGVLLKVQGQSLRAVDRADQYNRAVSLAQSRLAAAEAGLPGVEQGRDESGYDWRAEVEGPYLPDGVVDSQRMGLSLYRVQVSVSWQDGDKPRSITLETLRLAAAPS